MLGVCRRLYFFLFIFPFAVVAEEQKLPRPGSAACRALVSLYHFPSDLLRERIPSYRAGFSTSKYLVRPIYPSDIARLTAMYNDPELKRMERSEISDVGELLAWYQINAFYMQEMASYANFLMAIHDHESNSLIGVFQAYQLENETLTIGYALIRGHWGRGIMSELLPLYLSHIEKTLGITKFRAEVSQSNERSNQILEKSGFRIIGTQSTPGFPSERDYIWYRSR